MSYYELKENDVFINTIEANPDCNFFVHSGTVYINNRTDISGTYSDNILGVPRGYVSLYEYNVNRGDGQKIYPFIVKGGHKQTFKTISDTEWNTQFDYGGSIISSSYNLSSSITRMRIEDSTSNEYPKLRALQSSLYHYNFFSKHYEFEKYYKNKEVNLINIPSVFYGSSIKKRSLELNYYISGTLAATATDLRGNGEIVETFGNNEGTVVGTVLYNEGILLLTSSAEIDSNIIEYETPTTSSWQRWGYGMNDQGTIGTTTLSASFGMKFQAISQFQNMTVLAKAPMFELNHSNNPTYIQASSSPLLSYTTSSYDFYEGVRPIKNIVHAEYTDELPPFGKETYISKICIYDESKKLIGICKLAKPIRKQEINEYLFKLKIDL